MSDQRGARASRRDWYENPLQRLQKSVQRSGTHNVLNSLPAPDSFVFHKSTKNDYDTIKLLLGDRPNPDGSMSQAWARIVSSTERTDLRPPVVFYDQVSSAHGTRTIQYPRSASSLLRKATELQPPFCFLQHDPIDEATKVREMLSALVLYQAAVTGIDTCAWQWNEFGESLIQALSYIHSRDAYNQWRHEQKLAALRPSDRNAGAEGHLQKNLQRETDYDESGDPAAEEPRAPSPIDGDANFCGTVRSRGSAIPIKPNTSLAKLKQNLGDQKFKLLDKIPSIPMIISQHKFGGSLFPFRMLIGKAEYKNTGEIIEVYAYIDHEGAKYASIVFMSHDSEGLEQTYDVNLLRDGVDLVDHLEYINTLTKESYKDDAKSARTAKLRSLICYYFFIAEHEGLIVNPKVDINGGFCKQLCAVCKELGTKDWSGPDSGSGEAADVGRIDDADTHSNGRSTAKHLNESGENDSELTRREESEVESSRIVRLRIRPKVLSEIIESESAENGRDWPDRSSRDHSSDGQPAAGVVVENAPTLELDLRPSQIAHEASQLSISHRTDPLNSHNAPVNTALTESSTLNERMVQRRSSQTSMGPDAGSDQSEIATTLSKLPITLADGTAENISPDRFDAESSGTTTGEQCDMNVDVYNSHTKINTHARPIDQSNHEPQLKDPRTDSSTEFVPIDISLPEPTLIRSYTSSTTPNRYTSTSVISNAVEAGPFSSHIVAQVGCNRPPTPEGSAERDLKSQTTPAITPTAVLHASSATDAILISDDEEKCLAFSPPRTTFNRPSEAGSQSQENVVDLTQLSPTPRGKKRKSLGPFYLYDSEGDDIAETDGSEWHRKSRGRRR